MISGFRVDTQGSDEENFGSGDQQPIPIGIDNLLLRGTILRTTDAVTGVVVYTGHNTKVMMN